MNKYEVRMRATFYWEGKIAKSMTMIDTVTGETMVEAMKKACRIQASISAELMNNDKGYTYGYEELVNFLDVDDLIVEISAIVPFK